MDNVFMLAGIGAEAVVLAVLLYRLTFKGFPIFCMYLAWGLASDLGGYFVNSHYHSDYFRIYLIQIAIDSLFQFGVLIELSHAVLRPLAKFLPRWTSVGVGILIALICAAIWPFASSPAFSGFRIEEQLLVHLQQTFSILRILFFLTLAACSQLLSIGWRDRELQIATGLGFYSMVSVAISVLHTRPEFFTQYHSMDQLVAVSYDCSLLYWVFCFAQQEAARREFSPQMQSLLLAVAGNARSTRISLTDAANEKTRNHLK